ncbi:MAG TPA: zinc ribbon domain-containing protein YjdM [Paenalcaligenes sp.]|nr:zinc ribbon domain-containing protein YjdM [Paenalcaligenes sp.]
MHNPPACPACQKEHTYQDGEQFICPDCMHEWPVQAEATEEDDDQLVVKDAHGTPLADGDDVYLIKDLRVKGSSTTLKKGTKVRSIRLLPGDHDIGCRIDGTPYELKSEFMKKA